MLFWKDIVGFEGSFEISIEGFVRSRPRYVEGRNGRRWHPQQLISQWTLPKGYKCVTLNLNGRKRNFLVHKLMLETFVGPCPPGHESCHRDGKPAHNVISNLEWGTPSKNNGADKDRDGTMYQRKKTHCPQGHPLEAPNLTNSLKRRCLACARAHAHVHVHGGDLQQVSDLKYQSICSRG